MVLNRISVYLTIDSVELFLVLATSGAILVVTLTVVIRGLLRKTTEEIRFIYKIVFLLDFAHLI